MESKETILKKHCNKFSFYERNLNTSQKDVYAAMSEYAKEVAKDFFIWYGVKTVGLLEYIKDIRPIVTSNEMEEKIKEFEGKTFDELFNLYLQSLNQ